MVGNKAVATIAICWAVFMVAMFASSAYGEGKKADAAIECVCPDSSLKSKEVE